MENKQQTAPANQQQTNSGSGQQSAGNNQHQTTSGTGQQSPGNNQPTTPEQSPGNDQPSSGNNQPPPTADNRIKDPKDWKTGDEPITGAQASYLETLASEAHEDIDTGITKAEASLKIEELREKTGRGAQGA